MKQKYTITVADVQMNIVTDEDSEAVVAIAGILDRRMREIYLQSGNRCPKTEAALLCALDYCAERNKLQAQVNQYEEQLADTETADLKERLAVLTAENEELKQSLEVAEKEIRVAKANEELSQDKIAILTDKAMNADIEINNLREELEALRTAFADTPIPTVEDTEDVPADEEIVVEVVEVPEEAPAAEIAEVIDEAPKAPVAAIADETDEPAIELKPLRSNDGDQLAFDLDKKEEDKKATIEKEKQKAQKRVRSMFDLITFDNV